MQLTYLYKKSLDILDACIPALGNAHLGSFLRQTWQIGRVMLGFGSKMVSSLKQLIIISKLENGLGWVLVDPYFFT